MMVTQTPDQNRPLLSVENLEVSFSLLEGEVKALHQVIFEINRGERLGIVGESGAGKSLLGFAILRLLSKPGYINQGKIWFDNQDLVKIGHKQLTHIRGNRISMIFQDPMATLNPVLTIETQMIECLYAHRKIRADEARKIVLEKLSMVQIPSPEKRLNQYPHELSGGMRQRVIIAIALLLDPELIIADEPTTALDVTIQAEIMSLLRDLCEQKGMALILITHDLGVVSQMTHRTMILYAGRIIEIAPTSEIIDHPNHPYTQGLIKSLPQSVKPGETLYQIQGQMPSIEKIPLGCSFHPRCDQSKPLCREQIPVLKQQVISKNRRIACHLYE